MDLTTVQARKEIAAKWATKYSLDVAVICAVIEQESGWNQWAMRYEPGFYARYIVNMTGLNNTEMTARATSYGLMQVMGQVARENGFAGQFLSQLCDPDVGIDFGCRKLVKCGTDEAGLLKYNGGSNPQYGQQVLARVQKYQDTEES